MLLAGRDLSPRFHTTYRNQWPEINNAFVTYNIEYDQFSDKLHGGSWISDSYSDKTGNGSLKYYCFFYYVFVSSLYLTRKWTINFGLKASFVQKEFGLG